MDQLYRLRAGAPAIVSRVAPSYRLVDRRPTEVEFAQWALQEEEALSELLRRDSRPWCFLVNPCRHEPRVFESAGDDVAGLARVVVSYGAAPGPWVKVGRELRRCGVDERDLEERLLFDAAESRSPAPVTSELLLHHIEIGAAAP